MVCNNTVKPPCLTTSPLIKRPSIQNTKMLAVKASLLDPASSRKPSSEIKGQIVLV